ncbi:MAG TPA: superoxide dismutase [Pseudonocardiaceae bacterium]|nr:superoxide dismutase [Pseudonocardiaceae bacterium]
MAIQRPICRRLAVAVVATVMTLTPVACGDDESSDESAPPAAAPAAPQNLSTLSGVDTFAAPKPGAEAVTYNPALVPEGASILASIMPAGRGYTQTRANLSVAGLLPNHAYVLRAHTQACGATAEEAGPPYQDRIDPAATPQANSTNPEYANPRNEIWLDVRTDTDGSASSGASVPFTFTDRAPASVVVYDAPATAPGQAGPLGAPVACLNLSSTPQSGAPQSGQ